MKKLFLILLVICIFVSCCACGNNTNIPTENEMETNTTINSNNDVNDDYSTDNSVIEESNKPSANDTSPTTSKSSTNENSTTTSKPTVSSKPSTNSSSSTSSGKPSTNENSSVTPSKPVHTHNYSNATCTQAATCSCGATKGSKLGHKFSGEFCARCGEKNPNYIKTYGLGEKWIVDGEWEFTVNSVTTHYLCNSITNSNKGYTNEQVVNVDFTYKNIGYTRSNGLLHFALFNTYDETGEGASSYACTHTASRKQCPIGTSSKSQMSYVLSNSSGEITFMVQNLDNSGNMIKAIFKLPVS